MVTVLKQRLTRRVFCTLLIELVALNAGLAAALYARSASWSGTEFSPKILLFALTATLVIQFGLWSFGLYSLRVVYSGRRVVASLAGAFVFLSVALFPVCYLFSLTGEPVFGVTLKFYVFLLAVFMLVVGVERFLVLKLFQGSYLGNVLVLGTGECTREVIREARKHHGTTMRLVGILGESDGQVGDVVEDVPVIGAVENLDDTVRDLQVNTIFLSLPYAHPKLPLDALIGYKFSGINIFDACRFYESVGQKILLEKLDPVALLFSGGYTMTRLRSLLKDVLEKFLALVLLLVLALPMILVTLLMRWTSPGPVIYRQKRVGKSRSEFTLYKFRTMTIDAEKDTGATWARKRDPRVTRLGKWLRRTRFDEVPQLINILKGDMAFVGPRPERPEFVTELGTIIPFYHYRHFVKPGLTGWAQVSFPYAANFEDSKEKLRYDLYYVKNMSIFFDVLILLATARAVARGSGC